MFFLPLAIGMWKKIVQQHVIVIYLSPTVFWFSIFVYIMFVKFCLWCLHSSTVYSLKVESKMSKNIFPYGYFNCSSVRAFACSCQHRDIINLFVNCFPLDFIIFLKWLKILLRFLCLSWTLFNYFSKSGQERI